MSWHTQHPLRQRMASLSSGLRVLALVAFVPFLILVTGCEHRQLVAPEIAPEIAPAADPPKSPGPEPKPRRTPDSQAACEEEVHLTGEIGPGALWSADKPACWNGDLVVYLHGYTPPAVPVALPDFGPIRDSLLARGFAVVASSYSENGYAVKEGMAQSHQLRGIFVSRVASPRQTLLLGQSLGGIIGLLLAQKYPDQYDGSMLVSGVVGGSRAEITYIGDIRVLFDRFYPGAIPGSLFDVPPGVPFNPNWVLGAISTPEGQQKFPLFLAFAAARGLPLGPGNEPVLATLNALGFQWMGAMDLFDRTHSHVLYDNRGTTYTTQGVPQETIDWVNAGVARYDATPDAEAYLAHYGGPSGDLRNPVLTLHTSRDPVVPLFHEDLLGQVASGPWLLQRRVVRFGHAAFSVSELMTNFANLVDWVGTGQKPAS